MYVNNNNNNMKATSARNTGRVLFSVRVTIRVTHEFTPQRCSGPLTVQIASRSLRDPAKKQNATSTGRTDMYPS
jgi:hypothetical protein